MAVIILVQKFALVDKGRALDNGSRLIFIPASSIAGYQFASMFWI